jgi:general secretion pathway protein L
MSRKVLGLDIRSTSVAAVVVKSGLRESWIVEAQRVPIAAGTESDPRGLRAALETIAETMDLEQADCAVAIPAAFFSSRNLPVPFGTPKKIRMVLPFELESSMPFAADEVAVDFGILDGGSKEGGTEVLAIAVQKARLGPVIEDLAAAAIDPERVTPSGLALAGCLAHAAEADEPTFLVDIGDDFGAVLFTVGPQLRLFRSFPLPPAPEARRRTIGNHVRMTLGAIDELAPSARAVERIHVSGNGLDGGFDLAALAAGLPVDVEVADLGERMNVSREGAAAEGWSPAAMDGALALALAEIEGIAAFNFHRSHFPGKKLVSRHRENLVRTGILAAVVLLIMLGSLVGRTMLAQNRLDELNQQMAAVFRETFPEVKKVADPFQQMQISLQELKKSAALSGENRSAPPSLEVLKRISESIPEDIAVVIERLVFGPDSLTITGTTSGFNSVDEIKGRLERIDGFKKVTINSANTDRSGKEINFQLKVDL